MHTPRAHGALAESQARVTARHERHVTAPHVTRLTDGAPLSGSYWASGKREQTGAELRVMVDVFNGRAERRALRLVRLVERS